MYATMRNDHTITFACYNQLAYSHQLIDSSNPAEVDFSRIAAVDNGSIDGVREPLQTRQAWERA
jgi:hypothetical protein